MSRRVVVIADDRTGALETGGALARRGRPVPVVPWPSTAPIDQAGPFVLDVATRHLAAATAARRVRRLLDDPATAGAAVVLKLDSTLRGNWAVEAFAVATHRRERLMVVPAFPGAGRVCRAGIVYEHGRPVADGAAGRDPRTPLATSNAAELLTGAGFTEVSVAATPADAEAWLVRGSGTTVVCDAADEATLAALGRVWASASDVGFVGTAASIAAAVGALDDGLDHEPAPQPAEPALVVVGSLHPVARAQVAVLAADGWSVEVVGRPAAERRFRHVVVTPEEISTDGHDAAAHEVAALAGELLSTGAWATLVVVGGDTAAAVLGDRVVSVAGLLAPGVPWGRPAAGGPLVVTKPGGFGDERTIARLLGGP